MLMQPFSYLFSYLCLSYVAGCSCDEGFSVFHSNDNLIRVVLTARESLNLEGTTEMAYYPCAVWKF